ncbi:Arginine/serine-rich protein PNISR [Caenorhabditis elegans]|uniref:Arginine/serine-rich protein PNISR n=1 Tax=Caenorhabditis elegans TaxID=6239 RepID=Q9U252_CAEEL|nr:Arginine/serine-rich protein PNISR [Caenorhabditis elegans]CAB63392.2 Arginine/serine-rich protein PNISR [Caenorhabditis elegans]|eukprot:NP_492878.2 Regulator of SYnapse formation [Caenorhabditis elegans]
MEDWTNYHQAQPAESVDWAQLAQQWMAMRDTDDRRAGNSHDFAQNHQLPWHQPRHPGPPAHQDWGDWSANRDEQWRGPPGPSGPSGPPVYHNQGPPRGYPPPPPQGADTWRGAPPPAHHGHFGPPGHHFQGPPQHFPPGPPRPHFPGPPGPHRPPEHYPGPPRPQAPAAPPPKSLFPSAQKPKPLFAAASSAPSFFGAPQRPPPQLHFFQESPSVQHDFQQPDFQPDFQPENYQNSPEPPAQAGPKGVPPPAPLMASGPTNPYAMNKEARKKLPAWILEGLEKAEREKQKQWEKEEKLKKAEEEKARRRAEAGKSKFDSSSDEESPENEKFPVGNGKSEYQEDDNDSEDDLEERREQFIRCVKTLMMNVLLESSNDVIMRIIQEELREHEKLQFERKKLATAPKIIGNSSALAALAAFGDGEDSDNSSDDGVGDDMEPRQESSGSAELNGASGAAEAGTPEAGGGEFKAPVGIPRKFSVKTDDVKPSVNDDGEGVDDLHVPDSKNGDNKKSEKSSSEKKREREMRDDEKERKSSKKSKKRSKSREKEQSSSRHNHRSRSRSSERDRRRKRSRSSERRRDRGDRDRHSRR